MAFVRGVIFASTRRSSRLSVSGRLSTNTGTAPRRTKALAVLTKVNVGRITSSPGPTFSSSAAISRAWVQLVVSSTLPAPVIAPSRAWHCRVNGPSPDRCMLSTARRR